MNAVTQTVCVARPSAARRDGRLPRPAYSRGRRAGCGRNGGECAAGSLRMASFGAVRSHYRQRVRVVCRAIRRHIRRAGIGRGACHRSARERGSFVAGNAGGHAVRPPRPRGPTAMIGARARSAAGFEQGTGRAGNRGEVRGQDISRTPFRRKAGAFPWLHMGASVGARAARKGKANRFNASNGTTSHFWPKASRP